MRSKWITLSLAMLLSGCASIGPVQIGIDRNRYNDMIQQTENEQTLANIVKIHYLDTVSVLKVASVTSSYTLTPFNTQTNNGLIGYEKQAVGGVSTVTRTFNFTPSFGYSDSPTISYVPVQGTEFASSMMTPVQLETLHLFAYGGPNDPDFLLRLVFQSINNIDNASAASTAKPFAIPKYEHYYSLMHQMRDFFRSEKCTLVPTTIKENYALAIHCFNSDASHIVKRIFHVPLDSPDIIITQTFIPNAPRYVFFLQTRSVNGIFDYLSHGVEVPLEDEIAGYVPVLRYPDGTPFDWSPLFEGLFHVCWSNREPTDAFVKVFVHRHWFFIRNSDTASKATFGFVNRLMTLTAAQQVPAAGPVLTIPAR